MNKDKWVIRDWANKSIFDDIEFNDYLDAHDYLTEALYDRGVPDKEMDIEIGEYWIRCTNDITENEL